MAFRENISFQEALQIVLGEMKPIGTVSVPLSQALRRVLASEIHAEEDIPHFDNSAMDGFAIRYSDSSTQEREYKLLGEAAAGSPYSKPIDHNGAIRIMTGAPIPEGADTVVEQELATVENDHVRFSRMIDRGKNVRRAGEDIRTGDLVMEKGSLLRPPHIGVLASLGFSTVDVFQKPKVGYLVTGNELVETTESPTVGFIRNSNGYSISGLIADTGCDPQPIERAKDSREDLRRKIVEGFSHDALITSGGVSVGKHDLVLDVLAELGAELCFWKVNIKPGKPFAFGIYRHAERIVPVFALPGNPVSTVITFIQFVRPALRMMMGCKARSVSTLKARMDMNIEKKDGKRHFLRGIVTMRDGEMVANVSGTQSSAVLTSLVKANCLIIIPESVTQVRTGDSVEIQLINEDFIY